VVGSGIQEILGIFSISDLVDLIHIPPPTVVVVVVVLVVVVVVVE